MGNIKAGDDIFFTATMAEVLEKQGHFEDALMIYKILVDTTPWDQTLSYKTREAQRGSPSARKSPAKGNA